MENQLTILAESLEQKIQVLTEIQAYNKRQEQAFLSDAVDMEQFDAAVEEKGKLIESYCKEGFLKCQNDKLSFTTKGFLVSNTIISELKAVLLRESL